MFKIFKEKIAKIIKRQDINCIPSKKILDTIYNNSTLEEYQQIENILDNYRIILQPKLTILSTTSKRYQQNMSITVKNQNEEISVIKYDHSSQEGVKVYIDTLTLSRDDLMRLSKIAGFNDDEIKITKGLLLRLAYQECQVDHDKQEIYINKELLFYLNNSTLNEKEKKEAAKIFYIFVLYNIFPEIDSRYKANNLIETPELEKYIIESIEYFKKYKKTVNDYETDKYLENAFAPNPN